MLCMNFLICLEWPSMCTPSLPRYVRSAQNPRCAQKLIPAISFVCSFNRMLVRTTSSLNVGVDAQRCRRKSWPTMIYCIPTPSFKYEAYARMFLTTFSGVSVHRSLLPSCMKQIDGGGDVKFKNSRQFGILRNVNPPRARMATTNEVSKFKFL